MTQDVEMLPCPFCRGEAAIESQPSYSQAANTYNRYRAWCDQCGFGLDWHGYEPDAITAWNTRPTPDTRPAAAGSVRVVPVDLTEAMRIAISRDLGFRYEPQAIRSLWSAALAAAPTPDAAASNLPRDQYGKQAFRSGAAWAVSFQAVRGSAPDLNDVEQAFAAAPDAAASEDAVPAGEWRSPDLRDIHTDVERLRAHDLGGQRLRDLLRGAMDMLRAADAELAS